MSWIEKCYNQNRLAAWTLRITDPRTFVDLVYQHNQDIEKILATNAYWSHLYANYVLNAPFPLGEKAIATDEYFSYCYAHYVLDAPFPLGEKMIATSAEWSYSYARFVLKKPFPLGEKAITTSDYYKEEYEKHFKVKL